MTRATDVDASVPAAGIVPIATAVTRFLARYVDDLAFVEGEGLLSTGLLDSLAAVELIAFLERRFGLVVTDEDLELANFDSVTAIVALVHRGTAR